MKQLRILDELIALLSAQNATEGKRMFVGLDGYIDKIQKVVHAQTASENQYFATIPELAARINRAAGKSAQLELVSQVVKAGGNAPIMAHALGMLGVKNHCIGNFGGEFIHPAFQKMSSNCTLLSLGNPAETNALEFDDGKLILSELSAFSLLDWAYVQHAYSANKLVGLMNDCHIVAMVDWCNLPFATDIWKGILKDILPNLDKATERQYFFDLADPTKKTESEIREVLDVISSYSKYGKVTLGLNENEAVRLAHALYSIEGKSFSTDAKLEEICLYVFDQLDISLLLVHPLDSSVIVNSEGVRRIPGRLVKKPRISTGGGDNLNAGFCFAQMAGCNAEVSAVLGMATSGGYVQNGQSPDLKGLVAYLRNWREELVN